MSKKSEKIAALIESCRGQTLDAHYLAYFQCFNQQLFYEAHDVLEELWLTDRHGPSGAFYKGLIQLAGAFVHLQKSRPGPAAALFKLAQTNLGAYPAGYERLDLLAILALIRNWLATLEGRNESPVLLTSGNVPRIELLPQAAPVVYNPFGPGTALSLLLLLACSVRPSC